jgi:hypothetical protein
MLRAPVDPGGDPIQFFHSDRGRFERTYVAFLYVVVEAWSSPVMRPAHELAESLTSLEEVTSVLRQARKDGGLEAMRQVRDYMFHRDQREYWDEGRAAVVMQMHTHEAIYQAFSKMFLAAITGLKARPEAKAE